MFHNNDVPGDIGIGKYSKQEIHVRTCWDSTCPAQTNANITHNLGYNPLVAIRWSTSISSGVATTVFNPCESYYERER